MENSKYLKTNMMQRLQAFLCATGLCLMLSTVGMAVADDTEVFFGTASSSGETRPNVLLVLDTSGSMGNKDGGTITRLDRMKTAVRRLLEDDVNMNIGLMQYSGVYGGGAVLYPVTHLEDIVCEGFDCKTPATADNVYYVDGQYGDVEQTVSNGNVDADGNILSLGQSGSTAQAVGLRFAGINISRGATILGARLEFVAQSTIESAADLEVKIEEVGNSDPFTESNNAVKSRSFSAGVSWEADEWYENTLYQTPDIGSLVQGVIGNSNWCNGNALTFKIEGTGERKAYSYDKAFADNVDYVPRLRIIQDSSTVVNEDDCWGGLTTIDRKVNSQYDDAEQRLPDYYSYYPDLTSKELDVPWDGNKDYVQATGVRFKNIDIPQGAEIDSAFLQFTVRTKRSDTIDLTISAENHVDPLPYNYYPTPSYRSLFPYSIDWDNVPNSGVGQKVDSPDISDLIQQMVNSPYWTEGSAMAFQLRKKSGIGRRSFRSYDHGASDAPRLVINYVSGAGGPGAAPVESTSNQPGTPVYSTSTAREEMLDIVDGLLATGGTPGVDSYYEAALYMRGEPVYFGRQRGATTNPWKRERFRISHEDSYIGGKVKRDSNCTDANLFSSACRSEQIIGNPKYKSPMLGSCQANHIVLLSDGETDRNSVTPKILDMIGENSCTESGDTACATDLARWLNNTDHSKKLADAQKIKTHTIAFNLDGAGKDFMKRIAIAGGGGAYEADSADELLAVLNDIASNVADVDTSFTAPAATVNQFNRLTHRDDIYFSLFKPGATPKWTGNIKRFRIGKKADASGDVLIRDREGMPAVDESTGFFADHAFSFWPEESDAGVDLTTPDGSAVARGGAANQLVLNGRKVYTWLNDASTAITTPIMLTAEEQKLHESNALLTDARLGITGIESDSNLQTAYRQKLVQWARGVDVNDSDEDGSTTDIRREMGDPMHSRPVIVNYATGDSNNPVSSVVYVGTNEGYLHAIDAATGAERFAFVPNELLKNLNEFYLNTGDGFDRPYGLDGPLSIWREDNNNNLVVDSGDSAYLFVGMRRGGKSYYALDVTNPDQPKLAWTIKGGAGGTAGFENMGQSWSRLTPVQMHIKGKTEDVLIFGGGYDDNQDNNSAMAASSHTVDDEGNGIYIVEAKTGKLLWSGLKGSGGSKSFSDMQYGFNSHIRAIDINRDGLVDQMYAADAGGQLWRFDVAQYHAASGSTDDLIAGGVIADFSTTSADGHRRFYNEPDVSLIENGGERFLSISIGSGWRANPLEEVTEDRFYMVRQYAVYEAPVGYGKRSAGGSYSALTEADLVNVSTHVNPPTNKYGWFLDFSRSGEKVLGTSVTFDGKVIFSTFVPTVQVAVCSPEIGSGRAYVLDVVSGAPVLDLDNDGTESASPILTTDDRSTELSRGGIPPEAMVLITEDAIDEPQILFGGEQLDTGITNRTRRTFWSDQGESGTIIASENDTDDGTGSDTETGGETSPDAPTPPQI